MRYETGHASLVGDRASNQDRCCVIDQSHCAMLIVADGMGGHPGGEDAAQITVEVCKKRFRAQTAQIEDPGAFLSACIMQAHHEVYEFGCGQSPPIDPRTTAVLALVQQNSACWAHVGDSRSYLFRNGKVVERTRDHSYVEQLYEEGLLLEWELDSHPNRNIVTRCVGGDRPAPAVTLSKATPLRTNDVILLCSDGLWCTIEEHALAARLQKPEPLPGQVLEIARDAERSGSPQSDNVSVVALRWLGEAQAPSEPAAKHDNSAVKDEELAAAIAEIKRVSMEFAQERKQK